MSIETTHLTKRFKKVTAVDDVSFTAPDGEVFGLLGPNGAGKTTTLRLLATLLQPTAGRARVGGHDVRQAPERARAQLGILLEEAGLYERLTPREHLRYYGRLRGMHGPALEARVDALIADLELGDFADRRASGFSYGMRRRVLLASALVHDPPHLVLDEPTIGLDVMSVRIVRRLIARYRAAGRCVLLSTHNLAEVERLCDRVAIIYRGRVHACGTPAELRARTGAKDLEDAFVALIGEERLRADVL